MVHHDAEAMAHMGSVKLCMYHMRSKNSHMNV